MKINNYSLFNSIILRSPLLSFETIHTINYNYLKEVSSDKVFLETIFLASPLLYDELQKLMVNKISKPKEEKRLQYSILRYLIRMCTRCTPFGLFAGCTVGKIKEENNIEIVDNPSIILPAINQNKRCTRLDMNYLCTLGEKLAKQPEIKDKLKYFSNSSIYQLGSKIRYVEYQYRDTRRKHHLVSVDNSEYLQIILNKALDGIYFHTLVEILVTMGFDFEQSKNFIEELISSQLLISELEPSVTGEDFLEQIISILDGLKGIEEIKSKLIQIHSSLNSLNNSIIGLPVEEYKNIISIIESLGVKFEAQYVFQTDMIKPAIKCTIKKQIAEDVLKGIEILNKLTPKYAETNISRFKDAFCDRYEEQEIPLLLALDTESGIGYKQGTQDTGDIALLVDDIYTSNINAENNIKWTPEQAFLFNKYLLSVKEYKSEIEITDKDLESFKADLNDLPETIAAMIQIYKDKILITSVSGPSAANLLGRFCYADSEIFNFVKEIIQKEEENNPDVIFAEIVHLPESRTGNILFRPILRKYEIPYLAKSSVADEFQLNLNDLFISVRKGRIVLRSKRLNKEVVPRLSTAHNYSYNALPIYQFLCDLQTQNLRRGVSFNWGPISNEFDFLPRVSYKNLIFSLATWKIKKENIKSMFDIEEDEKLLTQIKEWRQKNKMPAFITLDEGDNELFINLENPLLVRTLFSVIKNKDIFQIKEFLFDPETAVVKSEEGSFNNQIILAFYKEKQLSKVE